MSNKTIVCACGFEGNETEFTYADPYGEMCNSCYWERLSQHTEPEPDIPQYCIEHDWSDTCYCTHCGEKMQDCG